MTRFIALACSALLLISCASFHAAKLSQISRGLSRAEVIQALGSPKNAVIRNDIEVLHYTENTGWWVYDYYYVRLVGGKVESFGLEREDEKVTDTDPPLKLER